MSNAFTTKPLLDAEWLKANRHSHLSSIGGRRGAEKITSKSEIWPPAKPVSKPPTSRQEAISGRGQGEG
jgi:hypothetical protein